jgi:hypothetical protein
MRTKPGLPKFAWEQPNSVSKFTSFMFWEAKLTAIKVISTKVSEKKKLFMVHAKWR